MSRSGKVSRKRNHGMQWRGQNVPEEWAMTRNYHTLLHRCQVAQAVGARTDGRCYWVGCEMPIVSYPHAVPAWQGGVDHQLNRAGVCSVHSGVVHRAGWRGDRARLYLQEWLARWHERTGMTPERWFALASGRVVIRDLTDAAGGER